jgi:5'-deoxynucleotidase YfbR-like HD superfamily hydrolase
MKKIQIQEILIFLKRIAYSESGSHSWRLALAVMVSGTHTKTHIDVGRAVCLALMHDLSGVSQAPEKEGAVRGITDDLSFGDWIYGMWREYEDQKTPEAKFVKSLAEIANTTRS